MALLFSEKISLRKTAFLLSIVAFLALLFLLYGSEDMTPVALIKKLRDSHLVLQVMNQIPHIPADLTSDIISDLKTDVLSPQVIAGVKKFVFFIGYGRSGHSIIGSIMDAHPHVVIAHEFFLFSKFPKLEQIPS